MPFISITYPPKYPLTESEKKWLEERKPPTKQPYKTTADDNFCRYCSRYNTHCAPWFRDVAYCPTDKGGDFKDAAEFESRMVATIARGEFYRPCHSVDVEKCAYPVEGNCCACHIKYARLAVEQEMEKEGK